MQKNASAIFVNMPPPCELTPKIEKIKKIIRARVQNCNKLIFSFKKINSLL